MIKMQSRRRGSIFTYRAMCPVVGCDVRTGWFHKQIDVTDTIEHHTKTAHAPKVEEVEPDGEDG